MLQRSALQPSSFSEGTQRLSLEQGYFTVMDTFFHVLRPSFKSESCELEVLLIGRNNVSILPKKKKKEREISERVQ